jgi:hypothetical protein
MVAILPTYDCWKKLQTVITADIHVYAFYPYDPPPPTPLLVLSVT